MTITTTPAPTITPCPVAWCPDAGHHEWVELSWKGSGDWQRIHSRRLDTDGLFLLKYYENQDGPRNQRDPDPLDDYGHAVVDLDEVLEIRQVQNIDVAARLHLAMGDAVAIATSNPGCTEDTSAVRRVLAERAVLDAVQEMTNGRAGQNAVIEAYERLTLARAELAEVTE